MKRFVRYICIIIVIALFFSIPVNAQELTPYSSAYFAAYDSFISLVGGRTFEVWFRVTAKGSMLELGTSSIAIQQSSDEEDWETLFTFTPSYSPQMICTNTGYHCDCVTFSGVDGYYYRAKVTFYAKNSSGTGYIFDTAETLYIPPSS